jgi:arylsulfatase A
MSPPDIATGRRSKAAIRRLCVWSVLLLFFGLCATAASPPNIVIIFADDLGYGDLACYGHPSIHTPHLDRMASEGMRFTDFYAAAPACTPSRAGLLTGRLPIRSGMAGTPERSVAMTDSTGGLPTNEITIAGALKTKGYATACIGKWHLGHLPEFLPTRHGFDYFFGVRFANNMEWVRGIKRPPLPLASLDPKREWWRMALLRNEEIIEEDTDPHLLTSRYTEEAVQFITRNKRNPFFLYLAHTYPHAPLFASKKFQQRSAGGLYGDVMEELDWSVGEILEALRKEGLTENTLVIFTSDNGPALSLNLAGGSSGLLRDGKGTPWEGGMRVPAIAWWPGKIKAGVVNRELACAMDLFNTSLNLAGVAVPSDRIIDGVDMTPMLLGKGASERDVMFYYQFDRLCAVRKGAFKAHVATYLAALPKPLLYQLAHDPGEKFDVAAEHPDVLADLLREVEKHREKLVPGTPQF